MDYVWSAWNWLWPSYGFDSSKFKMLLKTGSIRISLHKRKCEETVSNLKIELLDLIKQGKDEHYRIKAESVIVNERKAAVYGILLVLCENLVSKLALIESSESVPEDLDEAVATLAYAAPRVDVEELRQAVQQLVLKYGPEIETEATSENPHVNPKVLEGLSVDIPSEEVVNKFLEDYYGHNRSLLKDEDVAPGSPSKKLRRNPSGNSISRSGNTTAATFAPLEPSAPAPPPLNPDYVGNDDGSVSKDDVSNLYPNVDVSKTTKRKFDTDEDASEKDNEKEEGDDAWESLNQRLQALKDATK